MIQREHILSKHLKNWVRDAVAADHEFFVFDRAPAMKNAMVAFTRQKARGVRKSTPDTLLQVIDIPDIWCELKWPPNEPDDDQHRMLSRLRAIGRHAFWDTSIENYYRALKDRGVPMRPNAAFLAQYHDAAVLSEIAKAEAKASKAPRASKPRSPRATAGKIRRAHESGYWSP